MASRPNYAGQWNQAGGIASYGYAGMFWKSVPKDDWPTDDESISEIKSQWNEPYGDMRQELVFIGQEIDSRSMLKALNECLLSDDDVLKGEDYWKTFNDPFPVWAESL